MKTRTHSFPAREDDHLDDRRVVSIDREAVASSQALDRLTDRELDVLRRVAGGERNRDIAAALRISPRTVEVHVSHILQKLGVPSRTGAIGQAILLGIVTLDDLG